MLSILKTKLAVSALGAALVVGGGAAAFAANSATAHRAGAQPGRAPAATATHSSQDSQAGTHVSLEGVLTAASVSGASGKAATKGTLTVQPAGKSAAQQVAVTGDTRVNGWRARSLADLTNAKGERVQVQATKQSDGTLVAWKITVEGPGTDQTRQPGQSGTHGQAPASPTHTPEQESARSND